eukprot:COSAG01_NODE_379_length_17872_cov_8.030102_2_plen_193_part_00
MPPVVGSAAAPPAPRLHPAPGGCDLAVRRASPEGAALRCATLPPITAAFAATNTQTARGLWGGEGHRPSDRARPSSLTAAAPASVRRCFSAPRCEHLTPFQGSRPSGCATCSVDWAMPAIFSDASRRAFSVARRKTAPRRPPLHTTSAARPWPSPGRCRSRTMKCAGGSAASSNDSAVHHHSRGRLPPVMKS